MKTKNFASAFTIISAVSILLGVFLILNPVISEQAIGILSGTIFIIYGIAKLASYIFSAGLKSELLFDFITALINIGIGMFIISHHGQVISIVTIIIGITIFFESILKIITSSELKKSGYKNWLNERIAGISALVASVFIIFNPFRTVLAVYSLMGIAITASSIFHLWTSLQIMKIIEILEPVEVKAEFKNDNPEINLPDKENK